MVRGARVSGRLALISAFAVATACSAPERSHDPRSEAADAALPVTDAGMDGGQADAAGAEVDAGLTGSTADAAALDAAALDAAALDAAVDLGWPFPETLPAPCPEAPLDEGGGAPWEGWANFQHPPLLETAPGAPSDFAFGLVYRPSVTEAPGPAPGWEAELLVGPFGTSPLGAARCWSTFPAAFNVQRGNDDEYRARAASATRGLFGLFFRYRPPGGRWLYGDRGAGSADGLQAEMAGILVVREEAVRAPLIVATVNLQCRADWEHRRPLLIRALAKLDPDLVSFQEDCLVAGGGLGQADELRQQLATFTRRGYQLRRVHTHFGGGHDEGISLLSAHPIEGDGALELPHHHFPRRALWVDVAVRGVPLRFFATHLDFSFEARAARLESARRIIASLPADRPSIVAGDLNAEPEHEPVTALREATLVDLWIRANPNRRGLTFPAAAPSRRIDYLFASPELAERVRGATLLDEREAATLMSDHLGVAAALDLP